MPTTRHPYLEWDGPIAFAHRGGASDAPENTMPAFEYAVGLGYRYLETDVQVTADGVLLAFHDDDLHRTCGVRGRISAMPYSEVKTARVRGEAPIPLLEDVLGAWPDVRVNIDCKTDAAVPALVAALRRTAAHDRVLVAAFSDLRLHRLRSQLGDSVAMAVGPIGVAAMRFLRPRHLRGDALQVPVRQGPVRLVTPTFVERAHRLGLVVHVWTIDDPDEMERLLDLGVDGIMTDRPQALRDVFERRGIWP